MRDAADKAREEAKRMKPGAEQEALLSKAHQFEAQFGMNKF